MFIYWDCKILSGTATFHKRGVLDCNFQNPSEIPAPITDCSSAVFLLGSLCLLVLMSVSVLFSPSMCLDDI